MFFKNAVTPTPLISLPCANAKLIAKAEWYNPFGSVKDRVALSMIRGAQMQGLLQPGDTILEATSGNTGIALAALAAAQGYRCTIIMPENASRERLQLLHAYGARVELTPADAGMAGAVALARQLAATQTRCFYADQFVNPNNPLAHYRTTGPEIWNATDGKIDLFLAGVGTGGTLTGVGRYIKERHPGIRIVAITPSPGQTIPGLGAGFLPPILDSALPDEWLAVSAADAVASAKELARKTGFLTGISSGAVLHAAKILSLRPENSGKTLVTILPDSGERYLSSGIFD